jgi:hypothetical protein
MGILKSGWSPSFSPSPDHVIGGGPGGSWRVLVGPGGSFWRVPMWGTHHFGGWWGGLGCHLAGFPPTQGNIVFGSFSLVT